MADNFVTNAGSGGSTFASDDVASVQFPRVKVSVGSDGIAQDNWSPYRKLASADTNLAVVKGSAGAIGYILAINLTATVKFLKLYNKSTNPTLASDTPLHTIPIPASTTGAGVSLSIPGGLGGFTAGIALAITGAVGDTDTTALAANDVVLNLGLA